MVRISIVIPVYNVAPYLRACLDSVLAAAGTLEDADGRWLQNLYRGAARRRTYVGEASSPPQPKRVLQLPHGESGSTADVEIICVDDGSTDGSGEILDEWVEKVGGESRWTADRDHSDHSSTSTRNFDFTVIHQKNAGVSAAREAGFKAATGEWVWFVDGDDLLAPEALRSVVPALRDGVDLIWVDEERVGVGDSRVRGGRLGTQVGVANTRNFAKSDVSAMPTASATTRSAFREVTSSEAPMLVMHQCVFRRTSIADVPFERFLVGEDILFATKALLKARGIVHVAAPLYGYVQRTSSVMNAVRNCRRTSQSIAYMRELWGLYERERRRLHPRMVKQRHTQFFFALPSEILKFRGEERRRLFREWRAATGCGVVGFLVRAMVFRMYRLVKGR